MASTRPLNELELSVLERLLAGGDELATALRAQLPFALYAGAWFEGSQSFDIAFEQPVEPATVATAITFEPDLHVMYGDVYIGAPFLWVNEKGLLDSFQYPWVTPDMPDRLPQSHELLTREQSAERGVVHAPASQNPPRQWFRNSRR